MIGSQEISDIPDEDVVVLITVREPNEDTGVMETIVSHGVHLASGRNVILPNEDPRAFGARFDREMGEFVLSREQALGVADRQEKDKPSEGVADREAEQRAFVETQITMARKALLSGDDPHRAVIDATAGRFGAAGAARLADAIVKRVRDEQLTPGGPTPGRDEGPSP